MAKSLKSITIDIGIKIQLAKFLETRMLVESDSGSGKTWTLRKMAEECSGKVQQIIIDPEGDFVTLREKYPFALVSKTGGDIPLSIRHAETLAHKILETGISVIIDLYEFKQPEREEFVRVFCDALVNAPKKLWHPCVIYLDEAQMFCPEDKSAISTGSVIDLCTRGRKRGMAAVLATQRISILNKNAAASCKNKLMGSTSLPLDQKRVGAELGLHSKDDIRDLRNLNPGEFYAFGPAISKEITKFKVSDVKTTHVKSGSKLTAVPPTPAAIKKILSKLEDIPEEAERELNTKKEYQEEIKRLKGELKIASQTVRPVDNKNLEASKIQLEKSIRIDFDRQFKEAKTQLQNTYLQQINDAVGMAKKWKDYSVNVISFYNKLFMTYKKKFSDIGKLLDELAALGIELNIPPPEDIKMPVVNFTMPSLKISEPKKIAPLRQHDRIIVMEDDVTFKGLSSGSGEFRILRAAAMYYPKTISKVRIGAIAKLVPRGGSFTTYMSRLKTSGHLEKSGNEFLCTEAGYNYIKENGGVPAIPADLVGFWKEILGKESGAARILDFLAQSYPNAVTKEQIGEGTMMVPRGGSFTTYMSRVNSNGLMTKTSEGYKLSKELLPD